MDELKLVISTRFMRNLITKILAKAIRKKTGYQMDIQINAIEAETYDGKVRIHMDVDAEMNGEDLMDALKTAGLL